MSIAAITAPPNPAPAPGVTPVRPASPAASAQPAGGAFGPAVSLQIGSDAAGAAASGEKTASQPDAESRGYVRDAESRSLVFQVVDPASGDIVVQIPDAVVLKARAYARETAAGQSADPRSRPGATVEKRV